MNCFSITTTMILSVDRVATRPPQRCVATLISQGWWLFRVEDAVQYRSRKS